MIRFLLYSLFSICPFLLLSQSDDFFNYLVKNDIDSLTIEADFNYLISNKYVDTSVIAALSWNVGQIKNQAEATIKLRGRYRRRICTFPPVKIDLKKKDLRKLSLLDSIDNYKIVTHCDTTDIFDDYIKREYLGYQLYQKVADIHYHIHPVTITYKYKDSPKSVVKWSFLIENTESLAASHQISEYKKFISSDSSLSPEHHYVASLFMCMIGNDDFSFMQARNVSLLKDQTQIIPVPYDFDFSGLVNAHYAIPNPNLPRHGLRDRIVMTEYRDRALFEKIKTHYLGKEEEILEMINSAEYLSKSSRKDIKKYIAFFFKILDKSDVLTHLEVIPYK